MFSLKIFIFASVLACTLAASVDNTKVKIVSLESAIEPEGNYHYSYETDDGSKAQAVGDLKVLDKENTVEVAQGSYQYVGDDGKTYSVQYTADENGYQPVGEHIPQVPDLIKKALAYLATAPPPKDEKH